MFNFNPNKIKHNEEIGSGISGTVYPYQKSPIDKKWVVKSFITRQVRDFLDHVNEIVLGFNCDHPNVLPIKGYFIDFNDQKKTWDIYMKLPRMSNSVKKIIEEYKNNKKFIPEKVIVQYLYAATRGLQYLHKKGIPHGNVKPENLLLDENDNLKVADAGLGRLTSDEAYIAAEKAGTLFYVAPEIMDKTKVVKKKDLFRADCWGLGMIGLELCSLDLRFIDSNSSGMQKQGDVTKKIQELRGRYSDVLLDLIKSLLKWGPVKRIDLKFVQEILETYYSEVTGRKETDCGFELKQIEKQSQQIQVDFDIYESAEVLKLREIIKELEMKLQVMSVKEEQIEVKKIGMQEVKTNEEVKSDEDEPKRAQKEFLAFKKEIRNKWREEFEVKNEQGYRISIKSKEPCTNIQIINELMTDLTRLKQLTSCRRILENLYLSIELESISDQGLKEVALQIGVHLEGLQRLSLNFASNSISDQGLQEATFLISRNLKNLQQLSLHFCGNISDRGIKDVASNISFNLRNLEQLSFSFWSRGAYCKITDQGLAEVATQISLKLKKLQHLTFSFSTAFGDFISDQGLTEVASQISLNMKNLKHLSLSFETKGISGKGLTDVASQISRNLKNLQHLSLNFWSRDVHTKVTDQVLQEVAGQVRSELEKLEFFQLNDKDMLI